MSIGRVTLFCCSFASWTSKGMQSAEQRFASCASHPRNSCIALPQLDACRCREQHTKALTGGKCALEGWIWSG
ncbi:hypothetical protein M440DRAFT_1396514 [Trichoderma longibrachiatum ATCC 18648]|uniref:Uncharacterized protein n=1 Tax=Trichoderma longibrachiatum ATCC 18648 TaxID=983965 RepID=A0A2T4CIL6_TRILO|nr:hypothetical protein M440DRAFT_1396514 [Trichoderma longibrachiatum ATCC 18648]